MRFLTLSATHAGLHLRLHRANAEADRPPFVEKWQSFAVPAANPQVSDYPSLPNPVWTESYKKKGEHAQKLLDLNELVQTKEDEIKRRDAEYVGPVLTERYFQSRAVFPAYSLDAFPDAL